MFSRNTGGRPFKDKSLNLYTKAELCELLLSGFNNVWTAKNNDPKWQENEFSELKKICILYANEMKKKTGKNIGMFKITKQMMFSAVLHRLATTQDLKAFFNKTL
jgi:tRNA-dihydrouridine synthase